MFSNSSQLKDIKIIYKKFIFYGFAIFIIAVIISYFKSFEIFISGLFFNEINQSFQKNLLLKLLYDFFPIANIFLIIWLAFKFCILKNSFNQLFPILKAIIALFLILFIVELIKNIIDRSRPYDIKEFGGLAEYLAVRFNSSDFIPLKGIRYTSFPSGHATSGYIFLTLALITNNIKNIKYLTFTAIIAGIIISLVRIAQGGHYFSDVLGSLANCLIITGLFGLINFNTNSKIFIKLKKNLNFKFFNLIFNIIKWILFILLVIFFIFYSYQRFFI